MSILNDDAMKFELDLNVHYPSGLDRWRQRYETIREKLFDLPVLSLYKSSAVYVWCLLLLIFYSLKTKTKNGFVLMIPLLLTVCICCLGPCNGQYFRYLYGVHFCLPIVFILSMGFITGLQPA